MDIIWIFVVLIILVIILAIISALRIKYAEMQKKADAEGPLREMLTLLEKNLL